MKVIVLLFKRIYRYWLSEPALGKRSRLTSIGYWLTLIPFWKLIARTLLNAFYFVMPEWAGDSRPLVYASAPRPSWQCWFNPIYWLTWAAGFFYEWLVSRPYYNLGPAFPAVLVACLLGLLGYQSYVGANPWREGLYKKVLMEATQEGDNQLTRLALANLVARHPDQIELHLQQALLEERLGNMEGALKSMTTLAATNNNAAAAFWLLTKAFSLQDLALWPEEKHQQFRSLVEIVQAGAKGPTTVAARVLLAKYLVGIGASGEAIANLESVAGENGELMLYTASLQTQLGNQSRATQWAERAAKYFQEKLLATPADIPARLNLARSMLVLQREEDVARILSDGFKITRDPQLLIAGGEALANWANSIAKTEPNNDQNLIRRLQLLRKAVDLAPSNLLVLESLVNVSIQCASNSSSQVIALRNALLDGMEGEKLHFIQGTVELLQGNAENANAHLQIAATQTKNMPGVLNNLAVAMYQREQPDLDKALSLSNAALKILPEHPYFRETRGQILLQMKQYDAAILDLEFALVAKELQQPVHASLAIAYAAIGLQELSEIHLKLAGN